MERVTERGSLVEDSYPEYLEPALELHMKI